MNEEQEEDLKQRQWEVAHGVDVNAEASAPEQIISEIINPTQKVESLYDKYHAVRDYTLTNITKDEEIHELQDDAQLINALLQIRMFNCSHRILSEAKQTAALYRARGALQLKEIGTRRNYIERPKEQKKNII